MDAETVTQVGRLSGDFSRDALATIFAVLVVAAGGLFLALMGWIWRLLGKISASEAARIEDADRHREELRALNAEHYLRLDELHRERRHEQLEVNANLHLLNEFIDRQERRARTRRTPPKGGE